MFQVGLKPLGIFADSVTGMACIVRKNCASLVRPCHLLEHLYLATSDISHLEDSSGQNIIDEGEKLVSVSRCMSENVEDKRVRVM